MNKEAFRQLAHKGIQSNLIHLIRMIDYSTDDWMVVGKALVALSVPYYGGRGFLAIDSERSAHVVCASGHTPVRMHALIECFFDEKSKTLDCDALPILRSSELSACWVGLQDGIKNQCVGYGWDYRFAVG